MASSFVEYVFAFFVKSSLWAGSISLRALAMVVAYFLTLVGLIQVWGLSSPRASPSVMGSGVIPSVATTRLASELLVSLSSQCSSPSPLDTMRSAFAADLRSDGVGS